jgi:hypothetical protein
MRGTVSGRVAAAGGFLAATALIILAGRALAYALAAPSPLRSRLEGATGGPDAVLTAAVVVAVCVALAAGILWLAAVGVRERAALVRARAAAPRLRLVRTGARAAGFAITACLGFALLESYLHAHNGLPWHGLGCLAGPVHVSAIPILAALSVLASAGVEAVQHVLRWMRRTVRLLLDSPRAAGRGVPVPILFVELPVRPQLAAREARPRAPPLPAC